MSIHIITIQDFHYVINDRPYCLLIYEKKKKQKLQ